MPPPLTDSCRAQAHIPRPRPVPAAHLVLVSCRLVQSVPVECSRCRSSTSTSFILLILLDVLTGAAIAGATAVLAAAVSATVALSLPPPCRRLHHLHRAADRATPADRTADRTTDGAAADGTASDRATANRAADRAADRLRQATEGPPHAGRGRRGPPPCRPPRRSMIV